MFEFPADPKIGMLELKKINNVQYFCVSTICYKICVLKKLEICELHICFLVRFISYQHKQKGTT